MGLWTLVLIRLVLPPGFSNPLVKDDVLNNVRIVKEFNAMLPEFNTQESHKLSSPILSVSSTQNENILDISSVPFWKMALFGIWLLGFFMTLSILTKRYLYFRKVVRNSILLENEHINEILTHWRKAFKIKRSVDIVCSQQCLSPFTIGVLKPVIYLPQRLLDTDDKELLNSVISHEAVHIKHFDDLWIKLQNFIQSLYFFYPVVWYVNGRIHLARECLRDTCVISRGEISPRIFGKGILSLLKMNLIGSDEILYLPGFGSEKKKVTYRLKNLKSNRIFLYQRMLIYSFLVCFGIYVVPIFGSLQPEGVLKDKYVRGIQSETIGSNEIPSEEWSEVIEDVETANDTSDLDDKFVIPPERNDREAEESAVSVDTKITHVEQRLPAPVKIPRGMAEKEFRDLNFEIENNMTSPIRLDGQYTPPRLTKRVKPIYPLKARQDHVEGIVILEATTDVYGRVTEVKVLRSIPKLDQAALEAVKQWIYEPMIINGRPRSVIFKVTVIFELERLSIIVSS
jgi:TonB family protein